MIKSMNLLNPFYNMVKLKMILVIIALVSIHNEGVCEVRTNKDISKIIKSIKDKEEQHFINDTFHEWNILPKGQEVSLLSAQKKGIELTEIEINLLQLFDDVVINSKTPNCYFLLNEDRIGVCKLDGTIVVPPVSGVPRKIRALKGIRVGDTTPFSEIEEYFVARIGDKAKGVSGSIVALLDADSIDPIIPFGKYDYILPTTKGMKQYFYVAKKNGEDLFWGCVDNQGMEIVPCEYSDIIIEKGKYSGTNKSNLLNRVSDLKKDIAQYNCRMKDSMYVFQKIGEFFTEAGDFLVTLDESLRENGFYDSLSYNIGVANNNLYITKSNTSTISSVDQSTNAPREKVTQTLSNADIQNRQNDRRVYFQIETNLIKALNGDDTTTSAATYSQRMRQLREKWEKRGYGWEKSRYE